MTAWKNLHFRPPILKKLFGHRVSVDVILFRQVGSAYVFAGRLLIPDTDTNHYHILHFGNEEETVDPSQYEWTEVPE